MGWCTRRSCLKALLWKIHRQVNRLSVKLSLWLNVLLICWVETCCTLLIFLSYQWREVSEPIGCVKNKSQPWIMSPDTGTAWNLQTEGLNIPKTLAEIIDKESVRKRYKVQTNLYCTMYYRKTSGPDKSYEKQLMSLTNTEVLLKCLYCDKEGNSVATCLLP